MAVSRRNAVCQPAQGNMSIKNIRLIGIIAAVPLLLLIPFIAMRFTDEVNWTALDFIVMGVLLLATGLLCEFAFRVTRTTLVRVAAVGAVLFIFVMVWGELATGFFRRMIAGN